LCERTLFRNRQNASALSCYLSFGDDFGQVHNSAKTGQSFRSLIFNLSGLCQEALANLVTTDQKFRSQFLDGLNHRIWVLFRQRCDLACCFRRGAPGVSDDRGPSLSFTDMLSLSTNCDLDFLDCEHPRRVCDFRVDRRLYIGETYRGLRARGRVCTRPGACRLLRARRVRGRSHSTLTGAVRATASDALSSTDGTRARSWPLQAPTRRGNLRPPRDSDRS
jgi:hypothetical protein